MDIMNKYRKWTPESKNAIEINDDDEHFFDNGMVVMAMREEEFMNFLRRLPPFIADDVLKEYYKANYGTCCGITYHSNRKKVICPSCAEVVSLT